MFPRISIQIVTLNSQRYLKQCLDSVFDQNYKDFSVLIIDNASNDNGVRFIKENYPHTETKGPFFLQNVKNLGFSRAHNQGINLTKSELILIMNPDVILEPDFLENLVKVMEKDTRAGSAGGKLLKIKFGDPEIDEKTKTNIIDSTGLKVLKSRRFIDRGEGEEDKKQYDKKVNVFGISGACALYRRSALEDIKFPLLKGQTLKSSKQDKGEYFDEDFFAYKEDADLAWRLQLRGWKSVYAPKARAYHFRIGASSGRRFSQSRLVNYLSFRNHLWVLLKNSYCSNFFLHSWTILPYQLFKKFYLLFTQPFNFIKSGLSFCVKALKMLKKRKHILQNAKITPKQMRKWFQ